MNTDRNMNSKRSANAKEIRTPLRTTPMRGLVETELEQLKNRLVAALLDARSRVGMHAQIVQAANEAAALAWLTPYPLLLLPVLLEEKVRAALQKWQKQEQIRLRCAAGAFSHLAVISIEAGSARHRVRLEPLGGTDVENLRLEFANWVLASGASGPRSAG